LVQKTDFFDIYTMGDFIGQGAFAKIYEAIDKNSMKKYAVKTINYTTFNNPIVILNMIINEIQVLKRVSHPNIVQYYGAYLHEDTIYIVMEYCKNGSIQEIYSDMRKPLSEEQTIYLCYQVLKALQYLHENGIVHRDIKGANILLEEDGNVKIIDFGTSGDLFFGEEKEKRNRLSFVGTPYWMAPEIIQNLTGLQPYDEKVDIWSLGITAIECCQCDPPLAILEPVRALCVIPIAPSPTLSEGQWTGLFIEFIGRCLDKDPEKRDSAALLLEHPIFDNIKNNAGVFLEILNVLDDFDGWSWEESLEDKTGSIESLKKSLNSSSSTNNLDDFMESVQSEDSHNTISSPTATSSSKGSPKSYMGGHEDSVNFIRTKRREYFQKKN